MTCWRRLGDGQAAGVWQRVQEALLVELAAQGQLDWERAWLDSAPVPAQKGARKRGRVRAIAASRGASAPSWSTRAARRWRWV